MQRRVGARSKDDATPVETFRVESLLDNRATGSGSSVPGAYEEQGAADPSFSAAPRAHRAAR